LNEILNPIYHILLIGFFTGLSFLLMTFISNKIISIIELKHVLLLDIVCLCSLVLILFYTYNNTFLIFLTQLFIHCVNVSLAIKKLNDQNISKKGNYNISKKCYPCYNSIDDVQLWHKVYLKNNFLINKISNIKGTKLYLINSLLRLL